MNVVFHGFKFFGYTPGDLTKRASIKHASVYLVARCQRLKG